MEQGADPDISELAQRLRTRRLYKTLDMGRFGSDFGKQRQAERRIDHQFRQQLACGAVIKDESAAIGIYNPIGGDEERMHKKLHVLDAGKPREITEMSKMIEGLARKRRFKRYYYADPEDRDKAIGRGK